MNLKAYELINLPTYQLAISSIYNPTRYSLLPQRPSAADLQAGQALVYGMDRGRSMKPPVRPEKSFAGRIRPVYRRSIVQ